MGRQKKCHQPPKTSRVILLNKQFSGSWLDTDGNIAHEVIDFLQADEPDENGDSHYVFDAPHGSCPEVYVEGTSQKDSQQQYAAKYLLLTGPAQIKEANGCEFDILYVIELKRKIHSHPVSNSWRLTWKSDGRKDKNEEEKKEEKREKNLFLRLRNEFCSPKEALSRNKIIENKSIGKRMEELIPICCPKIDDDAKRRIKECVISAWNKFSDACERHKDILQKTKNIKFNRQSLEQIHAGEPEDACALYLTFSVKQMFKADPPIHVKCQQFVFQRTRGRLKEFDLSKSPGNPKYRKCKSDFDEVLKTVERCIDEKGRLVPFQPAKANDAERFKEMPLEKTFLDLIDLQDYEQAYTNMLCAVLKVREGEMMKQFCAFVRGRHERECDAQKWKALKNWNMNAWNGCTIGVAKETPVAISEDKDTLENGEDHSKSKSGTKGGRMDVCADILDRSGKSIQRVIIENKIDSPLNGVNKDDKITQLDTYYNQWGKLSSTEPLCFVVAPTRRIDEIKREIEKNDEGKDSEEMMGNRYFLVTYGEIAEFVEQFKDRIPENEISDSFVNEIIRAFKAHSLGSEDYYAWKVWLKTSQTS